MDFGDTHATNRPILGAGLTFTFGSVDKHGGFVGSMGGLFRYYTADTADFGKASVSEIGLPFTFGWRIDQVAFGAAMEGRKFFREGDPNIGLPQNAQVFFYGAYARIAFGPPGSIGGRFGIEGRYLWGFGTYTQLDINQLLNSGVLVQTATADMNAPHDWRVGFSFLPSPKVILRAEYEELALDIDLTTLSPDVTNPLANAQKNRNVGVSLGFIF